MKNKFKQLSEMRVYLTLWLTQAFSGLGSAMTSYALLIWSYQQEGSALMTAMLMVCSYAPYVLLSIFAGALSDRWNKKRTMLVCDAMAAACTLAVLFLLETGGLRLWHLYMVNAVNGLMNTFQSPASEVATTCVLPRKYYQKVGGFRYITNSLNGILTPAVATAFMGLAGIRAVIWFDLGTFAVAFVTLWLFIRIPEPERAAERKERLMTLVKQGLGFLRQNRGVMSLILFLAAINLVASMYNAAFPAMALSREGGSERAMGVVSTVVGVSSLLGGLLASWIKAPKSRVRVVCWTLLFSMSTENFFLAFGRNMWVWSVGAFLGWILIPLMSTNQEAALRLRIPMEMQGRVFAARNSLQFFTIPMGYFIGGFMVDRVFEPLMAGRGAGDWLVRLFGAGKGSGAGAFFAVIAVLGVLVCVLFMNDKHLKALQSEELRAYGADSTESSI